MRESVLLLLSTVVSCSASELWRSENHGAAPPLMKPAGVAKPLIPVTRSDATRKLVRYGPFDLPGVGVCLESEHLHSF